MPNADPDEVVPTPRHLALLAVCVPRPGHALALAARDHDLAVNELALWVSDLRGHLGRHIALAVLQDEDYLARLTASPAHTVLCVATTADEASVVLGELLPDLVTPALVRPPGTIPVILGDEDDDVRLTSLDPIALSTNH